MNTFYPKNPKRILLGIDYQVDFCEGGSLACAGAEAKIPLVNKLLQSDFYDCRIASKDWHPMNHVSFASTHGKQIFASVMNEIETPEGKFTYSQLLWPDHCIAGQPGAEFHKDILANLFNLIIYKGTNKNIDSYSALFDNTFSNGKIDIANATGLHWMLTPRQDLEFIDVYGIATDVCVWNTVRDIKQRVLDTHAFVAKHLGNKPYETKVRVIEDVCTGVTDEKHANAIQNMKDIGIEVITTADILK
jgi:nicotinamidase/pyrazinamidase